MPGSSSACNDPKWAVSLSLECKLTAEQQLNYCLKLEWNVVYVTFIHLLTF